MLLSVVAELVSIVLLLCSQVSNLVEDAKQGKALKGPSSSSFTTPLSPTTAHAIFASTVGACGFYCAPSLQAVRNTPRSCPRISMHACPARWQFGTTCSTMYSSHVLMLPSASLCSAFLTMHTALHQQQISSTCQLPCYHAGKHIVAW
jgi:hypothetical protein